MDLEFLKRRLANLSRHAYSSFIAELFATDGEKEGHEGFYHLPEAGEDVYYQPLLDSYGQSIHRVYLLHFPPWQVFHPHLIGGLDDPVLIKQLVMVRKLYKNEVGYWGMVSESLRKGRKLHALGLITNFAGLEKKVYYDYLIPEYQRLRRRYCLKEAPLLVGSCDSFIDLVPEKTRRVFAEWFERYSDGLKISFVGDSAAVDVFSAERCLGCGVSAGTRLPYEPMFVRYAIEKRAVLAEFEKLVNERAPEADLEKFLAANYRDIFGFRYDRIQTQVWLRFPELDISQHERRLDVFLRNAIVNDWELFELKRPINLTSTYRDVPVFVREVALAIQQIKNYKRLLSQDSVKRHFAREGIDYYEPTISLVIGRTPQIPHAQWQWLRRSNEENIKILTFDELLKELRLRLEERFLILETDSARG